MPDSSYSACSERNSVRYVHAVSEAGRILPSSSQWNSIEFDFNPIPKSSTGYDSLPSQYSKSYDYELVITDKQYFKRFLYISLTIPFVILAIVLLVHFLAHKHHHHGGSKNLTLAVGQSLTFFDSQKSGNYPSKNPVRFRGNSGLEDGKGHLVGGFYDSGNNIKFTFPTAYTVTLLSWTVIEYHEKYDDIDELDHVKDIIKWGSDYLLKVFASENATSGATIYSQVGDVGCWQRPEDMSVERPVLSCDGGASDLAGEIVAALSAASMVFTDEKDYSAALVKAAMQLYEVARKQEDSGHTYTAVDCGKGARNFYNSTGYKDELLWGGTWLFFATGNPSYLEHVAKNFQEAENKQTSSDKAIFYWNNKFTANAVLLTRLRFFHDIGLYESALQFSSNLTDQVICSYLSDKIFKRTNGGMILVRPNNDRPLEFVATASFLSKLYSDYLILVGRSGVTCSPTGFFTSKNLETFSKSQIGYILGDNPMKMSYVVGFGDQYPVKVHHRAASIKWDNNRYNCDEGDKWLHSKDGNPNILEGAMVAGPDKSDNFTDARDKPQFTEPSIASNAGLVAALIALHDAPRHPSDGVGVGVDKTGIFYNIHSIPTS